MSFQLPMDISQDPVTYAIPLFVAAIAIELILSHTQKIKLYDWKDSAACITMGLGSLVIGIGVKFVGYHVFDAIYQHRLFDLSFTPWVAFALFLADDFSFYWHHRLSHEVRILWAAHVNHHSSQNLNFSVALRQSWAELLYKYIFWLWMPWLGFHPLWIMGMMSISLIYQFLQHTQLVGKLGVFEYILNTPSHHRVHHASNPRYLDRNHAGILIIWDRLFGTFSEEIQDEKPVYGITTNIHTHNPLIIATHEFAALWKDVKQAPGIKNKLRYIFYPPGWSHNGPDLTAKTLRKPYANA